MLPGPDLSKGNIKLVISESWIKNFDY